MEFCWIFFQQYYCLPGKCDCLLNESAFLLASTALKMGKKAFPPPKKPFTCTKNNGHLAVGCGASDIAACSASTTKFRATVIWDKVCCIRDTDTLTPCWTAEDVNVTHWQAHGNATSFVAAFFVHNTWDSITQCSRMSLMQTHGWLKHQRQGEDMRWARVFRRGKGNSVWAGEGGNKYKSADLFFIFLRELNMFSRIRLILWKSCPFCEKRNRMILIVSLLL